MALIHVMWDLAHDLREAEIAILPSALSNHGQQAAADLCGNLAASLDSAQFTDQFLWDRIALGAAQMICPLNGDGLGALIETALDEAGKVEVLESLRKRFNAIRLHLVMSQFDVDNNVVQAVMAHLKSADGGFNIPEERFSRLDTMVQERLSQIGKAVRGVAPESKIKYLLAHGVRPGAVLSVLTGSS